jgi:hypothetical protein
MPRADRHPGARLTSWLVAAALLLPSRAHAAPTEAWQPLLQQAEAAAERAAGLPTDDPSAAAAWISAGRSFLRAARAVSLDQTADVEALHRKAIGAFEQGRRPTQEACDADTTAYLGDAVAACEVVAELLARQSVALDADLAARRSLFAGDLERCTAVARPVVAAAAPEPVGPPRRAVTQVRAPERRRPGSGVWAALGLAGGLAVVSLGTGLARLRRPFHGAAYQAIVDGAMAADADAVVGNEVGWDAGSDMCALAREAGADGGVVNAAIAGRCARWDALGRASVATGVLAGVAAAAAVVLLVVDGRQRRRQVASTQPRVHLGPLRGGLVLYGSF